MKNFKLKNNITIRITDEVFSAIRISHYKERYAKKRDAKHQLVHYHAFYTDCYFSTYMCKENLYEVSQIKNIVIQWQFAVIVKNYLNN